MAGLYRNVLSICLMTALSGAVMAKSQYSVNSLRCEELKPWSTLMHCQRNDEPAIRDANPSNNIAMTQTLAWSTLPIGLLAFGVADRRHALKRARQ